MRERKSYRLNLSCRAFYKEIELSGAMERISVGTTSACDVRLLDTLFFEPFILNFICSDGRWQILCSEKVYVGENSVQKLRAASLEEGKDYSVRYAKSGSIFLNLSIMPDFEAEMREFVSFIPDCGKKGFSVGTEKYPGDITVFSDYSEEANIVFEAKDGGLEIVSLKSRYGILKNGVRAKAGDRIDCTDFFSVAEVTFYLAPEGIYANARRKIRASGYSVTDVFMSSSGLEYPLFNRSTRLKTEPDTDPIQVLDPPAMPQKPKTNLVMQLMPALAMVVLTIVVRGFMSDAGNVSFLLFSVCSMSLGVITSVVSVSNAQKEYTESLTQRQRQYLSYIDGKRKEIEQARAEERRMLENEFPDTDMQGRVIRRFEGRLFDRKAEDEDFLQIRVGTGDRPARRVIEFKRQEKYDSSDSLAGIPEELEREYRYVHDAPIIVDAAHDGVIGLVGGAKETFELVKVMLLDVVIRQYYEDVSVVLLLPENAEEDFAWARWIPHLYNDRLGVRNIVWNEESKNSIFEHLYTELGRRDAKGPDGSHIVVFSLYDWGIHKHPLSKYIANAAERNAAFIFCERRQEMLPAWCREILFLESESSGSVVDTENAIRACSVKFSHVSNEAMSKAARMLAPVYCEGVSLENRLTKNITLFELLDIYAASDMDLGSRWARSDVVSAMAAPIGVGAKQETVFLDLHEKAHGPHGLVAGTTGSGKSELLQTYILSMATLYHPYEVGFVIIDFKGGGMANQFRELPHLVGSITNIDGREIDRSLLSIRAELQKRQRLFAQHDVNNINAYIKLYKNGKVNTPLPHLILIVDEFAELKAEQPEFMKELISASRIGRSLGIHLILATQKPSGQVSEQIWSNSRFRLCLKVQTREDSNEVLKSPLAAEIAEPGRAYMQVGNNEIFELFQSAYSGADIEAGCVGEKQEFSVYKIGFGGTRRLAYRQSGKSSGGSETTQLSAVVDAVCEYCRTEGIKRLPQICLAPLPELIPYDGPSAKKTAAGGLRIEIGVYDDPENQYQGEAGLDLSSDNLLIIGAVQMGKTNLLQLMIRTAAEQYSPGQLQVYIMDFASMTLKAFEGMNHVGGVVVPGENERIKNLFKLLRVMLDERKGRLLEAGVSSFGAYREAGCDDLPHVLVMLDNFAVFKELYEETFDAELQFLTREGPTYGMHFIITNVRTAGFGYRYMSNFGVRIALTCNEESEYSNVFDRCRMTPKSLPGRMICRLDGEFYEAQAYLAFEGEREIDRTNAIRAFVEEINRKYAGETARKIPSVPETLSMDYLQENYGIRRARRYLYPLGIDYASVEPVWLDFSRMMDLAIVGREASARLSVLESLLRSIRYFALAWPVRLYIVDGYERRLKRWSESGFTEKYTIDCRALDEMLEECENELEYRQELLKAEDTESLDARPLLLYVIQNEEALEYLSDSRDLSERYQKIVKIGKMLKVMFLFSNVEDVPVNYNSPAFLKTLKEKRRMLLSGKLADVRFADIPSGAARAMKECARGDTFYLNGNDVQRVKLADK